MTVATRSEPKFRPSHLAADADVTRLLDAWSAGNSVAMDELAPLIEAELRRLARKYMARQTPGHTLQPTALVNEAYVRLLGRRGAKWSDREHFLAYMATAMRRLLVNHARDRVAAKRGGDATHVAFDEILDRPAGLPMQGAHSPARVELLDLDGALRGLAAIDPRQSRVVELRYFGGLTVEETARVMDLSPRTVKREWHTARLWLLRSLGNWKH
jgi:RNA polymerase sigma factor (TIGR02999 family)